MLKKDIRQLYRQKRKTLSLPQKLKLDDLLLIQFQKLRLPFLSVVLSYHPIEENNEVDTFLITDFLQFKNPGLQVAYPKIDLVESTMQAIVCDEEEAFAPNRYNIHEPVKCDAIAAAEIDLVLVPLLSFDRRGNRVGYGKGYYDHYLEHCRADTLKIGLSYFEPVDLIEDAGAHDIPLNFCITPQEAYVF
ncbi:5-formyltetrahydrofolate cyclo-ligase [Paraflavisolibacter sp. H34]|uniref:5-formyltetrahydrofolate cyclo-ligase n=1 Tax=Huijunlia imazamoxiresistens TaxID=3127457 RepID=UPI003017C408